MGLQEKKRYLILEKPLLFNIHKNLYFLIESYKYNRSKSIKKKILERPFNRKIQRNVFLTKKGWRDKINLK